MKQSFKWATLASALVAVGAAFIAGHSRADGIPETGALAYAGKLEAPDGAPLTGTRNLELKFWDVADGGSAPLCTTNSQSITLDQGRFSLTLPDGCTGAVRQHQNLWVEILVDGSSLGRAKAGAVPYAVAAAHALAAGVAENAERLGDLAPGDVQQRVSGQCTVGSSIREIAADGTVTCQPDTTTVYTGTNGVSITGTTVSADATLQRRNALMSTQCAGTNQSIKTISDTGAVTCETDNDTVYSGGTGVQVSGTTIQLASNQVTRTHLSGTETLVYEQDPGCGGGLSSSSTCTTQPCSHASGIDILYFWNCERTQCVSAAATPCTGLTQVGWLLSN